MTRLNIILVLAVAFSSTSTLAAGPEPQASSHRPPSSCTITPQDRFVWSCYMICFAVSRDYTGLFYDRPLDRVPEGDTEPRLIDLKNAIDAGVDALSVDLFIEDKHAHGAFQQLVNLINEHQLPINLSPMFDGFERPGLTEDQVVAKVLEWFQRFADEPCVVHCNDRPIIWTFGSPSLDPVAWQRIFKRLQDAGCNGHWILDGGGPLCLGPKPQFEKMAPWLDLFDAAYTFAPGSVPDRPILNAQLYRERYALQDKTWNGSTKIGYWRPEIAVYTSPEGTDHYRHSWDAIHQADIRWVQQATWNDFSENHGIMPSANDSTTFAELTRALVRSWKGLPSDVTEPRLFLGRMREVQVGEDTVYEMLALLPDTVQSATFELELLDGTGKPIHLAEPRTLNSTGIVAPHFTFTLSAIPEGRLLVPRATLRTPGHSTLVLEGEPSIVHPAGFYPERCYSWIYTPAHRQLPDVGIHFSLSSTTPGQLSVEATSPVPIADVEVLRNGLPVLVMRRQIGKAFPATHLKHEVHLPLNRRDHMDWGFYQVRVTTSDRRVAVSRPSFVDPPPGPADLIGYWPFDAGDDYRVLDESPWMRDGRLGARTHYPEHQPTRVPNPRGGKCLSFDGLDDRLQMDGPVVPPQKFTIECWLSPKTWGWPGKDKGATIFGTANADCSLSLDATGKLILGRKGDNGWVRVHGVDPVPLDKWTHVAVTFDGTTLTLFQNGTNVASADSPGIKKISRFGVGFNTVTLGSFFHGRIDDIRIHQRVLTPTEFTPCGTSQSPSDGRGEPPIRSPLLPDSPAGIPTHAKTSPITFPCTSVNRRSNSRRASRQFSA